MRKSSLLIIFGLIFALILAGCNSKKEPGVTPLEKELSKIVDGYFVAMKETSKAKLKPVVSWEIYNEYTPLKRAEQKELLGEIRSWSVDKDNPPIINTDTQQAVYTIDLQTTKRQIVMKLDIRPYFNEGLRVYGVEIAKSKLNKPSKEHGQSK